MKEFFKIGEISALYGIGVDSLRYYEEIGLIHPVRSHSGYRLYSKNDIWRLNVIRDLRELDFSMEQIGDYLKEPSTAGALSMLEKEKQALKEKMKRLRAMEENVRQRIRTMETALRLPLGTVRELQLPERRCHGIRKGYSESGEMDRLMKELLNRDRESLYIIGSNQFGSTLSMEQLPPSPPLRYDSVFVIDPKGAKTIPEGTYLSCCYRGDYSQTLEALGKLREYASARGLTLDRFALELLWIDNHTTADPAEYITEVQVRVL